MSGLVSLPVTQIDGSMSVFEVRGARWRVDLVALDRNRVLRGWTRGELARHARVDLKTLSTMFQERRRPVLGTVLGTVLAVAAALGLGLEEVIVFDDGATSVGSNVA